MRGGVTDAGRTNDKRQTISEDRATQPMDAGGLVSHMILALTVFFNSRMSKFMLHFMASLKDDPS